MAFNLRKLRTVAQGFPYGENVSPPEPREPNLPGHGPYVRDRKGFWQHFDQFIQEYQLEPNLRAFESERGILADVAMTLPLAYEFLGMQEDMPDWATQYCPGHDWEGVGGQFTCKVCRDYFVADDTDEP